MTLAEIYETLPPGSADKWLGYLPVYDRWFTPLRGTSPRILEFGVQNGGSLELWRRYFGPGTTIIGADINPDCRRFAKDGIQVFIGDQGDRAFLESLRDHAPFDVVIDDASHHAAHQLLAWDVLFHDTRAFYCIEDTHTAYWDAFRQPSVVPDAITLGFACVNTLHDCFRRAGTSEVFSDDEWRALIGEAHPLRQRLMGLHFYDSLMVFEIGANPLPARRK